ncbi:MAG: hypothetical protein NWR72_09650, partial [Bacteroidia bacterium]|nr:hypothetical protein [Bacteroidia bacterium]
GPFPNEFPLTDIYLYNINSNTWITYDTIPVARQRGSTQAVIDGDWVYFFNGLTQGHKWGWTEKVDRYNLATKTWEIMTDSPRARDHAVAVKSGTLVYIVGGRRSNAGNAGMHAYPQLEIDVYDLSTDSWTTLPPSANLPGLRGGLMAALQNNGLGHQQLSVWGGEYETGTHFSGIGLDLTTQTWSSLPDLTSKMHASQMIQLAPDTLFTIAGAISGGNEKQVTSADYIQRLFPATPFPIGSLWHEVAARDIGNQQIALNWSVEEPEGTTHYELEFRDQGGKWSHIGQEAAKGASQSQTYSSVASLLWLGTTGMVRIRAMGLDGTVSTSPVIEITREFSFPVHPNPIPADHRELHMSMKVDRARLYACDGKLVGEVRDTQTWQLADDLAPGLYRLQLLVGGQQSQQSLILE